MLITFKKVFVANPNKTPPILDILQKNKEKLLTFLRNFHNDRSGMYINNIFIFNISNQFLFIY